MIGLIIFIIILLNNLGFIQAKPQSRLKFKDFSIKSIEQILKNNNISSQKLRDKMRLSVPKIPFILVLSFSCWIAPCQKSMGSDINVTVHAGARQTFEGFGCSMIATDKVRYVYQNTPPEIRTQMADMVFKDLKMNILRMWSGNLNQDQDLNNIAKSFNNYKDFWILQEAKDRGVTIFLLAPSLKTSQRPWDPVAYGTKVAKFIRFIKDTYDIDVTDTGIANEPNVNYLSSKNPWSHDDINNVIMVLRDQLDAEGLKKVGIIAPETPNADRWATECIQGIKNNPLAWEDIIGIADHSYGSSPLEIQEQIIQNEEKQYWMTESSTNGPEGSLNDSIATDQLGRFLNDLNHGVDHWVFFIGYFSMPGASTDPDRDSGTKLVEYYQKDRQLIVHLKYWYFKNVRDAFDYGSVFRHCTSDLEGEMNAQQAGLVAAAAQNPDGTWTIGLVNQSGLNKRPLRQSYTVNIFVEELQGSGPIRFKAENSTKDDPNSPGATHTMTNGHLTIKMEPLELTTLRSIP